jgi:hypothetical protein
VYSRSGTIRRQRKRKHDDLSNSASAKRVAPTAENTGVQSHLTGDIEATRGLLCGLGSSHESSLGALTSLSEACAAVWHNAMEFNNNSKGFFLFEDQAESWVDSRVFVCIWKPFNATDTKGQHLQPHSGVATPFWRSDPMMRYYDT